jgi:O-methyltransferase
MSQNELTNLDELNKPGFINTVKVGLKLHGFWKCLALFIYLKQEERNFIKTARSESERSYRKNLLGQFKKIHNNVACPHSPFQFPLLSTYLEDLDVEGPIVELGVFKGGSTAKLSLLAKKTNRKLYVCDSFQGLPKPVIEGENESPIFDTSNSFVFQEGEFAGSLDEVKKNVTEYGAIEVCEFVPGFFNESLPTLDVSPALIFIDVDYVSSARDCLKYLWPRLKKNGYLFTHEAHMEDYIKGCMDMKWWQETLGEPPPLMFGAGGGISPVVTGLCFIKKE